MEKIDLVVSYVDNQDKVWRKNYIDYCVKYNMRVKIGDLHSNRYEDIGLINYHLKLVNKNLTFINKIFLLLSNKEQAPKDLPSNVEIVLHKDFIPFKYLPTFNSTTIEMFLWNIPNLSEKFIYANDDMLPIGKLQPSDFFLDNTIKMNYYTNEKLQISNNDFRQQCSNSYNHILKELGLKYDYTTFERPHHSYTPMIKSHCKEAFTLLEKYILPNIRAFRTPQQHNQYIYPNFEKIKYGILPSPIDFCYTDLKEKLDLNHQIVCVNNTFNKEYTKQFIKEINEICK